MKTQLTYIAVVAFFTVLSPEPLKTLYVIAILLMLIITIKEPSK